MANGFPIPLDEVRHLLRVQAGQIRLHRKLRSRLDESDLVQDALLRIHDRRDQFRGTTAAEMARWVTKILTNVAIDAIRQELAQARDPDRELRLEAAVAQSSTLWGPVLPDPADTPARAALKREQLRALTEALEALPGDQRDAVTAKDLLGLSVEEVADRMDKTKQAVAGLLMRGRRRLRQIMREGGMGNV